MAMATEAQKEGGKGVTNSFVAGRDVAHKRGGCERPQTQRALVEPAPALAPRVRTVCPGAVVVAVVRARDTRRAAQRLELGAAGRQLLREARVLRLERRALPLHVREPRHGRRGCCGGACGRGGGRGGTLDARREGRDTGRAQVGAVGVACVRGDAGCEQTARGGEAARAAAVLGRRVAAQRARARGVLAARGRAADRARGRVLEHEALRERVRGHPRARAALRGEVHAPPEAVGHVVRHHAERAANADVRRGPGAGAARPGRRLAAPPLLRHRLCRVGAAVWGAHRHCRRFTPSFFLWEKERVCWRERWMAHAIG